MTFVENLETGDIPSHTVVFEHNGFVVRGTLELPAPADDARGTRTSLALVLPGFMGTQRDPVIAATARTLRRAGIASLRIDFIGHGRSDGRLSDMTLPDQLAQARRAFEYARALPGVGQVALVGHSQGGVIAAMLAGELGADAVAALVLYAPATIIPASLRAGDILGTGFDPADPPAHVRVFGARISREYLVTGQRLPLVDVASRYEGPALILHGSSDATVPVAASERFAPQLANATLEILPRHDHEFLRDPDAPAARAVEFIGRALG